MVIPQMELGSYWISNCKSKVQKLLDKIKHFIEYFLKILNNSQFMDDRAELETHSELLLFPF